MSYFLGLREMVNKSSGSAFDTMLEILQDFTNAAKADDSAVGDRIIAHIANTMSDRASTEKAFNQLLEEYRLKIMPKVTDSWELLSEQQRTACGKI